MPRAIAYALLLVLGPVQIGVAVTLIHPVLDRPGCWLITLLAAVTAFEAARRCLKGRPEAPAWTWLRLWVTRLWVTPLALLLGAHLLVTAIFFRPELGQLLRALRPEPATKAVILDILPPRTVPQDPVPALRALVELIACLLQAAASFAIRILFATPPWLLTVAAGVGCWTWRKR